MAGRVASCRSRPQSPQPEREPCMSCLVPCMRAAGRAASEWAGGGWIRSGAVLCLVVCVAAAEDASRSGYINNKPPLPLPSLTRTQMPHTNARRHKCPCGTFVAHQSALLQTSSDIPVHLHTRHQDCQITLDPMAPREPDWAQAASPAPNPHCSVPTCHRLVAYCVTRSTEGPYATSLAAPACCVLLPQSHASVMLVPPDSASTQVSLKLELTPLFCSAWLGKNSKINVFRGALNQ